MSNKPRPWPNNAKHARDESAEELQAAVRKLSKLTDEYFHIDDSAKLRLIALINNHNQRALRLLESVGAQTHP
jgi:hypothetical protein